MTKLLQGLRDELVRWKGRLRGRKRRAAAEALLGYVTDRREMILYPEFRALGRQIGSGPTESMCKSLSRRMKGIGMRWRAKNAESHLWTTVSLKNFTWSEPAPLPTLGTFTKGGSPTSSRAFRRRSLILSSAATVSCTSPI